MKQLISPLAYKYARAHLATHVRTPTREKITAYEAAADFLWQRRKAFTYLQNFPFIPAAAITAILALLEGFGLKQELKPLVQLLANHRRLWLLSSILSATATRMRRELHHPRCTITSAAPLTDNQKETLATHAHALWGDHLDFYYQEDSSLIAGVRMSAHFSRWEHSIAHTLRLLHHKLLAGVDNG